MRLAALGILAAAMGSSSLAAAVIASSDATDSRDASPIFGLTIPNGYRQWELIAPALAPLNELRVVLGNSSAIEAYRIGTLLFSDGTVLVKLAWKQVQSPEFEPASVPGAPTTVQVMVKDSKKYPTTGGWGFGRFIEEMQHRTCFACHEARVKAQDFVFTRFAP
jgi:hypothetical protein